MERYISDIVKHDDFRLGVFNLIDAGCGSGKTYFCVNHLISIFPELKPEEIAVITSRSITANQIEQNEDVQAKHIHANEFLDEEFWALTNIGVKVMTYDGAVKFLLESNSGKLTEDSTKVIVVDECHALWSDMYIPGMDIVSVLLNRIIVSGKTYVIGLTATSKIVREYITDKFNEIHDVCEPIPTRYPAEHLILTRMKYVPGLMKVLSGKTIILVPRAGHAAYLERLIPQSAAVVSQSRHTAGAAGIKAEPYMNAIRQSIVENKVLPARIQRTNNITGQFEDFALNTLIATTTFREGFSLIEDSGVDNVVCCFFDEMHITQFLGRCRYSVKNLIIAPPDQIQVTTQYAEYFNRAQTSYCKLWHGKESDWFDSIHTLVAGDSVDNIDMFTCEVEDLPPSDFLGDISKYLNGEWFFSDSWDEIISSAKAWKILPGVRAKDYSKNKIIQFMKRNSYQCEFGDTSSHRCKQTYRFIKENKSNDIQNNN